MTRNQFMAFFSILLIFALVGSLWILTVPEKELIATDENEITILEEEVPLGPPSIIYNAGYGIEWTTDALFIPTHYEDPENSIELNTIGNTTAILPLTGLSRSEAEAITGSVIKRYRGSRIPSFTYDFKQFYSVDGKLTVLYYDTIDDQVLFALTADRSIASKTKFFTSSHLEPYAVEDFEKMTLELLNAVRVAYGKSPLIFNTHVAEVSQEHSSSMVSDDYFSHINTDGSTPKERLRAADITFKDYGETLTAGIWTPMDVIATWMNSPPHRNILLGDYTEGGVGISTGRSTYGIYFTMNLIQN